MNLLCFLSIFVLSGAPLSEENDQEDRCHFHYVDIDHPLTLQQIQEKYTAYDTKDGMITDRIQFITDYDENHLTLGTYPLTVIVQNSQQQSTTQTDYIVVRILSLRYCRQRRKSFIKTSEIRFQTANCFRILNARTTEKKLQRNK